jgi:energy-coupling factor transporter transmembrane protein EcfT
MRRNNLFWGIVIIIAGVLLLLNQLGLIPGNFWGIFWPLLLIVLGLWFLFGMTMFRHAVKAENLSIPLEGVSEAEIELNHGAGRLRVSGLGDSNDLLSGSFYGGVEQELSRQGGRLRLTLKAPFDRYWFFPPVGRHETLDWSLSFNQGVPLKLILKTGASETVMDLSNLKVTELEIETGASSNQITLPANAGFTRASIHAGAASIKLQVPDGVAGRIHTQGALTGTNIDTRRYPPTAGGYETVGFDSAANRVEIYIEAGVGSIEVR